MKLLVTGGCGFIGSNFIRQVLAAREGWKVVNIDLLTYAGNPDNLADVAGDSRYTFVHGDVAESAAVESAARGVDAIVNFAAESHVDRSIEGAAPFIRTNVAGTLTLLDEALRLGIGRFLQVSTDEVYGALELDDPRSFREADPLLPNSPYAASKAGADLLARSFHRTHGLPVIVTRCSNNYGPYQFPEKFIPLMIVRGFEKKPMPIYGDGLYVRDWIHVEDHCRALLAVLERGEPGEIYNIGGRSELPNLEVAGRILAHLGLPATLTEHVPDRRGHDRRYSVDDAKLRGALGWTSERNFEEGLASTIAWYRDHTAWWRRITSGDYLVERRSAAPPGR